MLFNSIEFALFLPIVFILYWVVFDGNLKLQNAFLLVVSYLFYGWWDWRFLFLIAFTSFCSWLSGLLIERSDACGYASRSKVWLWLNIILNLLILVFFKYFNFFTDTFVRLLGTCGISLHTRTLDIILPIGISFYTFQALSYSIDVYKGRIRPTHDIVAFFAYVSFFPQLVAGPIERAVSLLPQIQSVRRFRYDQAVDGCRHILWGLFKKIAVADVCAVYVDKVYADFHSYSGSTLCLAAFLFSVQIYGDFSGYSDIAIGSAKLLGIDLTRNFRYPYFSRSIVEFWRNWHISLTTWFRDYIYIPLGGNRVTKAKLIRNTWVVFLCCGLWHGAAWHYVLWGAYHACLYVPVIVTGANRKYKTTVAEGKSVPSLREAVQMLGTFILVTIGWIFFRSDSVALSCDYLRNMLDVSLFSVPWLISSNYWPSAAVSIAALAVVEWKYRADPCVLRMKFRSGTIRWIGYGILIGWIFVNYHVSSQFIYFQF